MARPAVDRELLAALDDKLGPSNTDKLLALVPADVSKLVTKHDLAIFGAELRAELKGEMADLRGELRTDMANLRAELKTEMAELRTELKGEMAELRTGLKGEMADLRSEVKTDIAGLDVRMERRMRSQLLTTIAVVSGIVSLNTAIQILAS